MRPDRRVRRYVFNDVERCIAGRCIGGRCPCLCHVESLDSRATTGTWFDDAADWGLSAAFALRF